jgi:hypothetical protein
MPRRPGHCTICGAPGEEHCTQQHERIARMLARYRKTCSPVSSNAPTARPPHDQEWFCSRESAARAANTTCPTTRK